MEEENNNKQEIQPTNEQIQNNQNSPKRTVKNLVFWVAVGTISTVIGGLIVAVVTAFLQIGGLRDEVQQQNTTIQGNKTQIENLNTTIHEQNTKINSLEYNITTITNSVQGQNARGQRQEVQIGDNNRIEDSFNPSQ